MGRDVAPLGRKVGRLGLCLWDSINIMGNKMIGKDEEEKRIVKGLAFVGIAADSNTVEVDVRNGRIIRINPLHYDRKYKPEEFRPWKIEARGRTFEPKMKSLIPPLSLGYKNRVYSPNRILYPLKRVDWDPKGSRNTENRGRSKYVRISWDEATELVVNELKRIKETYGMEAVFSQSDGHAETKVIHAAHGCHRKLLKLLGGFTLQTRNTDSWEGWIWGAKHAWGMENLGQMVPVTNVISDMSENTDLILFWGCDPETTPWGWSGQLASRACYWFTELGIESIYICPDLNYGAAVHADKWIPIRPNTDAALQLAIAYMWITEDLYDKAYVETHTVGFDRFRDYVMGKEEGVPKTPAWAAGITGIPERTIKSLARKWASRRTTIAHGNGGPYIRGPYSTEPARLEVLLLAMQGSGEAGAASGQDDRVEHLPAPSSKPVAAASIHSAPAGGRPRVEIRGYPTAVYPEMPGSRCHSPPSHQLVGNDDPLERARREAVHQIHVPRGRVP